MGNYWTNRRRRETQKGKPVVHSTTQRMEFSVDHVSYTYEFMTDSKSGLSYIWKSKDLIYGPHNHQCTDEGRKIEQLLHDTKTIIARFGVKSANTELINKLKDVVLVLDESPLKDTDFLKSIKDCISKYEEV